MKLPIIEVKTNGACKAFVPFTRLPKGSAGKRYRLVEVTDDAETGIPVSGPVELGQKAIDDICEAVEDAVGSGSRAWDMIAPQDLCMAFYEQFKARQMLAAPVDGDG